MLWITLRLEVAMVENLQIKQYKTYTKTPIAIIKVKKLHPVRELYEKLFDLQKYTKLLIFVDDEKNDIDNIYMLVWRIVNNIDAKRDIFLKKEFIGIDATNKNEIDGFKREWPGDTECDLKVINNLQKRKIINIDEEFLRKFYI